MLCLQRSTSCCVTLYGESTILHALIGPTTVQVTVVHAVVQPTIIITNGPLLAEGQINNPGYLPKPDIQPRLYA